MANEPTFDEFYRAAKSLYPDVDRETLGSAYEQTFGRKPVLTQGPSKRDFVDAAIKLGMPDDKAAEAWESEFNTLGVGQDALRGVKRGEAAVGRTVGAVSQLGDDLAQKIGLTGDGLLRTLTGALPGINPAQAISSAAKTLSPGLGESIADYWTNVGKQNAPEVGAQAQVFDEQGFNPASVANAGFWAGGIPEMGIGMSPMFLTAGMGGLPAAAAGAGIGGSMEGLGGTYLDQKAAGDPDALKQGLMMTGGSAALNALPLARILGQSGGSLKSKAITGLLEGTTELAEEPLEAAITGGDPVQALKEGASVFPLAALMGGAMQNGPSGQTQTPEVDPLAAMRPETPPVAPVAEQATVDTYEEYAKQGIPEPVEKADKPAAEKYNRDLDPAKDSLLTAIAKSGGLNRDYLEAEGIDPAEFGELGADIRRVFTKKGDTPEGMAERLSQLGYPTVEDGTFSGPKLVELVQEELMGRKVYTPAGIENQMEQAEQVEQPSELERAETLPDLFEQASAVDLGRAEAAMEAGTDLEAAQKLWDIVRHGGGYKGLPSELVDLTAKQVTGKWQSGPGVNIVQSQSELPAEVQASLDGVGDLMGARINDQIYVVADNLKDPNDIQRVLAHEAVGHYGMERLLGDRWGGLVDQVQQLKTKDGVIAKFARDVQERYSDQEGYGPGIESSEIIAAMAESGSKHPLLDKIAAWMRESLRKLGLNMKLSRRELYNMIARASKSLEQADGTRADGSPLRVAQDNVSVKQSDDAELLAMWKDSQPVQGRETTEASIVLPDVSRDLYEKAQAAAQSIESGAATEGERESLRKYLRQARKDPEGSVQGMRGSGGSDASRGLQQAASGDLAVSSVPPKGASPDQVTAQAMAAPESQQESAPRDHLEVGGGRYSPAQWASFDDEQYSTWTQLAERQQQVIGEQRRGKQSWEQTSKNAAEQMKAGKITVEQLIDRQVGSVATAEELVAFKGMIKTQADKVKSLAQEYVNNKSDAVKVQLAAEQQKLALLASPYMGYSSEVARSLNIMKKVAAEVGSISEIADILDQSLGGQRDFDAAAERMAKGDYNKAMQESVKRVESTLWDKFYEYWINSILSDFTTHNVNMLSNAVYGFGLENASRVAAGLNPLSDYKLRYAAARFHGQLVGAMKGWKLAKEAFLTEEPQLSPSTKLEVNQHRAIKGKLGNAIRIPGRALTAEDEFFKAIAYYGRLGERAAMEAAQRGGDFRKTFVEMDGEMERIRELRQARGVAARAQNEAEVLRIDRELAGLKRSLDVHDDAWKDAEKQTFTTPLTGAIKDLNAALVKSRVGKLIVPFVRTPMNIFSSSLEYIPGVHLISKEGRNRSDLSPEDRAVVHGRAMMGGTVMASLLGLAGKGMLSGQGPEDYQEKMLLYQTGWQPYSIRLGDKWIQYNRFEPVGMIMGLAADMYELRGYMTEGELQELPTLVLKSFMHNFGEKTYLSGITDMAQAITDPERYAGSYLSRMAGSLVPNVAARRVGLADGYMRDANGILDGIRQRIPGEREKMAKRLDFAGQPRAQDYGAYGNPLRVSEVKNDPLATAMLKLGVRKSPPGRTIQGVKLSDADYEEYKSYVQQNIYKVLTPMVQSPQFQQAAQQNPEGAQMMLDKMYDDTRRELMQQYRMKKLFEEGPDWLKKVQKVKEDQRGTGSRYITE